MTCVEGGTHNDVTISTFYIDQRRINAVDYQACVSANVCTATPPPSSPDDDVKVTVRNAEHYCTWRGKRLATEFEWRHARAESDGVAEWTQTWWTADMKTCGSRCAGSDPRGPCDGAAPCFKHTPQRVVVGDAKKPRMPGLATKDSPTRHSFRCVSESATLPPLTLPARTTPKTPEAPTEADRATAHDVNEDALEKQVCESKGRSYVDCRDPNHYIKSNEPRQHLWRPYVENIGGGYVGVGIDQNYSFIAHAKSEWAWLFDYDPTVVHLHHVLKEIIKDSPTRADFVAHFQTQQRAKVLSLIAQSSTTSPADKAARREIFTVSRASLLSYYERQMTGRVSVPDITKKPGDTEPSRKAALKMGEASADPTFGWLATDESYAYVRALYLHDRIVIKKGDMLAKKTMQGIGKAAHALGVPIRVYYASNAPESWPHTKQYKANVLALPFDQQSVVLTSLSGIASGFAKQRGYWHYNVQSGAQQQSFMRKDGYASLKQLVWHRLPSNDSDLTTCGIIRGSP